MSYYYKMLLMLCIACLLVPSASAAESSMLKVVVVIDGSGSFRSRVNEATERAVELLDAMSQQQVHRWQKGAEEIHVVSLDALPEVIWTGSLTGLKEAGADFWKLRFTARGDYTGCTDVGAAFDLATKLLAADDSFSARYLFIYSDLIHEPPTTSLRTCAQAGGIPPALPWEALVGISTAIFWLPPDQKLMWNRAAVEHGLGDSIALYTTSESSAVEVPVPVKPTKTYTENERMVMREQALDTASTVGSWLLKAFASVVGLLVLLIAALMVVRRRHIRQSRRVALPSTANPR